MNHHNHSDQNFASKITFLESEQRMRLVPPEDLISQMPIHNNHTLLDIGAGSGFFTIPMAERTSCKVYAMDPDKRMLSVITHKAKAKGLHNIELIEDYIENLSIENNSIDFAMASLVLHEVSSLRVALSIVLEALKPGGHLMCLEYEKDDMILEGPPMIIRIKSNDLENTLLKIGFDIVKKAKINDSVYTVLAVKRIG